MVSEVEYENGKKMKLIFCFQLSTVDIICVKLRFIKLKTGRICVMHGISWMRGFLHFFLFADFCFQ